jgi:hypothetical protein
MLYTHFFCRIPNFWLLVLLFPGKGPSMLKSLLLTPKPPRLMRIWTGMEPKVLWRKVTPLCRTPAESKAQGLEKKWKYLEDVTSSGTSKPTDVLQKQIASKDYVPTMFELLAS